MSKNKKSRPIAPKAKPETARQSAARLSAGAPNRRRADQAYVALAAFSAMCGMPIRVYKSRAFINRSSA